MKVNKSSRIMSVTVVMLGAAMFTASVDAGSPPSRQTPYLVPKSEQGIVKVGPCQLPPCVGGRTCTPNARDYGYYEGKWRQWPTQQRYDQHFPQAVGSTPIQQSQTIQPGKVSSVNTGNTGNYSLTTPMDNLSTITVPDDPEPAPMMNDFNNSVISVPSNVVVPQGTPRKVDPLLDYSTNNVPGISTAPTISAPPALEAVPVESTPDFAPELNVVPTEVFPAPADDMEATLTAPAPSAEAPLLDVDGATDLDIEEDGSLSVPMTQQQTGAHSIIVSQNENSSVTPMNPYLAQNPYDMATIQVSHVEAVSEPATSAGVNPFDAAVIPSDVTPVQDKNFEAPNTTADSMPKNVESTANATTIGLDGFCPVTLRETETWTEGNEQWSVLHHGITYYLASAEQVQKFLENPDNYAPVMDGADPVLLTETGERQVGTVDNCVVFEGKLFMFTSEENLNKFFENTTNYMK